MAKRGREGGNLLNQTLKHNLNHDHEHDHDLINNLTLDTSNVNGKLQERVKEYIQEGIKNGYNIMLFHVRNGELTKVPEWFDMDATDKEGKRYKADINKLLLALSKKPYGYGILTGKQLYGFSSIGIDVDIDTEECKERLSKKIEELLDKHKIYYHKETTKSGRLHYYIALDKITDRIKSIPKLPYTGSCFKSKDGKEMQGEIELSIDKALVVYDGFINDKEPFFTLPVEVNKYQVFENFLEDWKKIFEPEKEKEAEKEAKKETAKEQIKEAKELFSKIVEAYKIIRKYHIVNGWEIEKVFSAYCIREKISTEQAIEGFKAIYGSEYDEKTTLRILELTKKKDLNLLPSLGSVYYHINTALNSGAELEDLEKQLLKKVLEDIASKGYSDYELPEYLQNVENIILDESTPKDKNGKKYYKESYFIEQVDSEAKEIKKVVYVSITTSKKGGIYEHHKLEKIKEIGIKADIIRLVKDGDVEDYEYLLNDKVRFRPSSDLSTTEDTVKKISKAVAKYSYSFDISLYKQYLTKKIRNYIKENGEPIPCIIGKNTGWSDDLRFFYHYGLDDAYHELSKEHILYKKGKAVIRNVEEQHRFIKAFLREGKLLGVLLVASVSSLLIKPFNIPGITVIISGNSGAGKTTSSLIATSLFYYSDDVLMNAQTTKVGLELTISSLNSLPVLIDEGALAGFNLSLNDLVFMVNSGTGRTRGTKNLSVDFKELKSNVFWTTETTDIDELKRTGAFRRVLNLVVNSWNDFTELFKPEERINEKYSGCGIDYIQYLIEHMEDVRKTFKEETKDFSSKYKEITTLALNLYSGLILLEKFYKTKFEDLRKTIDKVLDVAKASFIENKENVVEVFKDFLIANTTSKFHMVNTNGVIGEKLSNNRNIWGEYDVKTQTYYILVKSFKEIAKELGKERNLLEEELVRAGVLEVKDKDGKKGIVHRMKSTGGTVRVYKAKFGEKEETKIDSDAINNSVVDDEVVEF